LRILSEASSSPTLDRLRFKLGRQSKWHEYEPIAQPGNGDYEPYQRPLRLGEARTIACLDSDLFGLHPEAVRHASEFAKGRDSAAGAMNRLYVAESTYTITGAAADHRLPVRCKDIARIALALRCEIDGLLSGKPYEGSNLAFVRAAAKDLFANRGKCVVVAGLCQPTAVRMVVNYINRKLDNYGKTLAFSSPARSPGESITNLTADIDAGKVKTLLILGGNPAYNAPVDLRFGEALAKVPTQIHLSLYRNDTSRLCAWHVPQAHFLETWGDAADDGDPQTYSVIQPLIEPLYSGKSAIELLALAIDAEAAQTDTIVRETFKRFVEPNGDLEQRWRETLNDGQCKAAGTSATVSTASPTSAGFGFTTVDSIVIRGDAKAAAELPQPDITNGDLELIFLPDAKLYDGRFANNGWLQEMPDPMTKLTWDNAALMSPVTAEKLGVQSQDIVRLKYEGREIEAPVYVMPGQADGTVALPLGYGRTAAGKVGGSAADGIPPVGFNAYLLRTSKAMDFGSGLTVEPTGRKHVLATTQDHFAIDAVGLAAKAKRVPELVREATLKEYQHDPKFARQMVEHPPLDSLWQEKKYDGHRWGMTIDLSKCIGCGACIVACQAENNIPIVGKDRVLRGRQMQWIRVDRYFRGAPGQPAVVFQPVACHHCELAPCEEVCPVAATVHSEEGLNVMVYNRCVGTRYCSNNCPYKVRRFNFFNYHKEFEQPGNEVAKMANNPEVTVRSRGVMEKCTYCVQRIQNAKIKAKNERRPLADGEIQTACQQVCPARAIVFGDLSDKQAAVAKLAADNRAYGMLAELNIKPRTSYLARIRNPNPEFADE
jgi:molybdopterin-containing oxidoreductase family iron-sulfur binding subunit